MNDNALDDHYPGFDYSHDIPKGGKDVNKVASIILKEIRANKLPFPLMRYTMTEKDVYDKVQILKDYIPLWIDRSHNELKSHDGKWWLPSLFRGKGRQLIYRKDDWWLIDVVVDYFTEYERVKAKKIYASSLHDNWNDDECLKKMIVSCRKDGVVNCKTLRDSLFYIGRELAVFRVTRCKGLLQACLFDDFDGVTLEEFKRKRWIDMSAGWGDRLFTACSLDMDYVGFDPNEALRPGYYEMIGMLGDPEKQKVFDLPFEQSSDIIQNEIDVYGKFDIALCSPPFWTIEQYNGNNQSIDTYKTLDEWIVKFLFKSIKLLWDALDENGILCMNLANIRDCDMVGPMQLYIEEFLEGATWEGILTFSGRGTQDAPGAAYCWKKTSNPKLWNPKIERSLKEQFPKLHSMIKFI